MTQAQPLIQTLPMTLGAPMSDDPSNPTAIEIPLQIELPNGQTLFAAVALGGLPFDGQRQIAERITAAWNAFTGVTTEEIKAPVKCLHQIAEPAAVHPDDVAVDALAALMKAKLAKQRAKGYGGWNDKIQCTQQRLSTFLRTHVDKGDPVDVANFCAMLSARGEGIAAAPQAVQPAIMPKGESAAAQLRAMATNYAAGHNWDKLDARACIRGALEIEALRALLAAAPAHPAEGVPTSSDLRERLARLEAGCNAHTTPTVYEAIADSKAALDELDEARQRVGISLAATQPAAQGLDAPESEYQRGYRHGYNRRDAEVQGALL